LNDKPSDNATDNTNSDVNSRWWQCKWYSCTYALWTRMNYIKYYILNKWTRQIHMWILYKIKPNSERTYSKWQQFIKTDRKDGIQKQSDFTTNCYRW
jgi:hypothetical protein